jgi:beta-glucosidase
MIKTNFIKSLIAIVLLVCSPVIFAQVPVSSSVETDAKVEKLLKQMTLEEKVAMIHASSSFTSGGVKRLGIPELTTSDGPHGVRLEHGRDWIPDTNVEDAGTYLPTGITLASTWNPELGLKFGEVLGSEANYRGKDVILGPGVNIMRTPLNGRNFEYLSEDPFLAGQMAIGYIKGVQSQGVASCVKHFMANNQEQDRSNVNVEMSERALREIYLPAFKAAIQEGGAYTLMGAYNKFRGQFCTHNDYLINQILRNEWAFNGIVISDWGAVHSSREGLLYGTDIEMGTDLSMLPHPDYNKFFMADSAIAMVKSGKISESVIDQKVRRILKLMFKIQMFDKRQAGAYNTTEHQAVALKVAEEGIVLLKNESILPLNLQTIKSIAVIGANATRKQAGGGGSSQVKAKYEITPLEGLQNLAGSVVKISYAPGYEVSRKKQIDQTLIDEAVKKAKESNTVIVVGGFIHGYTDGWNDNAFDAEGQDKASIDLPFGQEKLIQAVITANPNTIVVLFGGGPSNISSWAGKAKAVLQVGYPGMEGGNALANILFGKVNPSGKLSFSWVKKLEDSPAHKLGEYPGKNLQVHYNEGIFVGYRYFDTYKVDPLFCFGHGLSYTTFKYSEVKATTTKNEVNVTLKISNNGKMEGAEVVQLYVGKDKSVVERAVKELKAFTKLSLKPGETKEVNLKISKDDLRYYNETQKQWVLEPGKYNIWVGSSSRDIRLSADVKVD